jgi:hypothetical protein
MAGWIRSSTCPGGTSEQPRERPLFPPRSFTPRRRSGDLSAVDVSAPRPKPLSGEVKRLWSLPASLLPLNFASYMIKSNGIAIVFRSGTCILSFYSSDFRSNCGHFKQR